MINGICVWSVNVLDRADYIPGGTGQWAGTTFHNVTQNRAALKTYWLFAPRTFYLMSSEHSDCEKSKLQKAKLLEGITVPKTWALGQRTVTFLKCRQSWFLLRPPAHQWLFCPYVLLCIHQYFDLLLLRYHTEWTRATLIFLWLTLKDPLCKGNHVLRWG